MWNIGLENKEVIQNKITLGDSVALKKGAQWHKKQKNMGIIHTYRIKNNKSE